LTESKVRSWDISPETLTQGHAKTAVSSLSLDAFWVNPYVDPKPPNFPRNSKSTTLLIWVFRVLF